MKRISVCLLGLLFSTAAYADEATCIAGVKTEGTFWSSRQFTAVDTFPDTSTNDLFKRADLSLIKQGMTVGQADRELGIISATSAVECQFCQSATKTYTVNVAVEPVGPKGSKASVILHIGFGQSVGDSVAKDMCDTIEPASP